MKHLVRLRAEDFDRSAVCCLGVQLAQVVRSMMIELGAVNWYAADVEAVGPLSLPQEPTPVLVGQSHQLVELVSKIDQFLRGVFFAVPATRIEPHFRQSVDTEDPVDADLGDAVVEIRAFDTSYFDIATQDRHLATVVADAFGVSVSSD